ncbi:MAG TPA: RNA polymerase sigma factor RpoD/SigA [Patescibacteria group bacterium]|nr:RNA polymerase sigma factor RpoD/SigA [Patescibacteria group bacterium]
MMPRPDQACGTSALSRYLSDIRAQRRLTRDEELEAGRRVFDGMLESQTDLVVSNLGFVVKIAREYQNKGVPLDDLLNEGNLGLIKAASRYDHRKGVRFITYASFWVRKSILTALAEQASLIRVPPYQMKKNLKPMSHFRPVSLDDDTRGDGHARLIDILIDHAATSPEHEAGQREELVHLRRVIGELSEKERRIISMRYGLSGEPASTLKEIGEQLCVSRERVRQIEAEALGKLRALIRRAPGPARQTMAAASR